MTVVTHLRPSSARRLAVGSPYTGIKWKLVHACEHGHHCQVSFANTCDKHCYMRSQVEGL